MSDGPHRSLQKRRHWKKVAEFADNSTFESQQVCDVVTDAFTADWRIDVPDDLAHAVGEILGAQQDSLFRDQKVMQLEALRHMTAGRGLGQLFLDCAIQCAAEGDAGEHGAESAVAAALAIWGARHCRQIEEHYRRESSERRARHTRDRIEEGIGGVPRQVLARQLLGREAPAPRKSSKRAGLDDGVRL